MAPSMSMAGPVRSWRLDSFVLVLVDMARIGGAGVVDVDDDNSGGDAAVVSTLPPTPLADAAVGGDSGSVSLGKM